MIVLVKTSDDAYQAGLLGLIAQILSSEIGEDSTIVNCCDYLPQEAEVVIIVARVRNRDRNIHKRLWQFNEINHYLSNRIPVLAIACRENCTECLSKFDEYQWDAVDWKDELASVCSKILRERR